ncbi:hypothetical protein KIH74_16305 [Kineosporia sp. J2-2]|uniref:Uncharacterized protein n=1 Tax=Kineosporia corallincola TaxID=2835133 RepID=A0ABS5THD9_9ACTN|nr:hypothetical protein [Kineosporia corallincola]MBT0770508.1 hypothetical protein [Kineosporia corallincola]
MASLIVILMLIGTVVLAPWLGADSRNLDSRNLDPRHFEPTHPLHPDTGINNG